MVISALLLDEQMNLRQQLQLHSPYDATEATHLAQILAFLECTPCPFHRETLAGHVTGSAIVVNLTYDQILLLHHRKLDRWLQPGGHCDGNPDPLTVAKIEVQEETGLFAAVANKRAIFDVDVHCIPAKENVPEHWHYDIRYLFVVSDREPLKKSEREVIDLQWFRLDELDRVNPDESLYRVRAKINTLQPCTILKQSNDK